MEKLEHLIDSENLPKVEEAEIEITEEGIVNRERSIGSITKSESISLGTLTSSNTKDFYFIDVPSGRVLTYAAVSSNPNIYVRFCTYDPATSTANPTNYYADTNKVGVLGNLPAGQYIFMVTYKDGYTNDASYNLLTNYNIDYSANMDILGVSNDLSRVKTEANSNIYINRKQVTSGNRAVNASWNDIFYVSSYLYDGYGDKWSYSSLLDQQYTNMNGITISRTSDMVYYVSEEYEFNTAMLIYLDQSNVANIRVHKAHNVYETYETQTSGNSFMVYDYDTDKCYELYLDSNELPENHRLLYNTAPK